MGFFVQETSVLLDVRVPLSEEECAPYRGVKPGVHDIVVEFIEKRAQKKTKDSLLKIVC